MSCSSLLKIVFIMILAGLPCLRAQSKATDLDISNAVLIEQTQGLEAVDKPLETHLQEQATASEETFKENPEEIFEAAVPDEIPFENDDPALDSLATATTEPAVEPVIRYEKTEALEPVLMLRGEPMEEAGENVEKERIRGRIVPEKRNIKRRRFMFRWVLKTDDGRRIPLKSNLQLLTLVRREDLLEGPVMLTGYFIASAINPELKYFKVEKAVPAGDTDDKGEDPAKKKKK